MPKTNNPVSKIFIGLTRQKYWYSFCLL